MKITIAAVGKLKEKYLKEACDEYKKRLSRFCDMEIIETYEKPAPENLSPSAIKELLRDEAEELETAVLKRRSLKSPFTLAVLDIEGKMPDSLQFSEWLSHVMQSGKPDITFVIGSSHGLSDIITEKADIKLSLSRMTFPHQLVRLILLEQLFRGYKILRGEIYHK